MDDKWSVGRRLLVLNILPREGNIVTLRIVKETRDALAISEDEMKELDMKRDNEGNVVWNEQKEKLKEIKLGDPTKGLIFDTLMKLSDANKLPLEYVELYDEYGKR